MEVSKGQTPLGFGLLFGFLFLSQSAFLILAHI